MIIQSDLGHSVELRHRDRELPLWHYHYNTRPKPYFHPLCTPAGHCLTLAEPPDHVWQRGLWYAIKFVNGDNFWEERESFGTQHTTSPLAITQEWDGQVHIASRLEWRRPADNVVVLHERREFRYSPLHIGTYALDFQTTLVPQCDVTLDRTPFTTWGGYSGLAFRGTTEWKDTRLLFADGSTSERPTGIRSLWCDLSGRFDGGPGQSTGSEGLDSMFQSGGLAIFDHPQNPRHPVPWYGNSQPGNYFLCASFLFEEPLSLAQGVSLTFRYRVLVHDDIWEQAQLQRAYDAYAGT
ncbi:MAG: PmoA family protein [Anaerolineae bacterium]|nr:PmoA family protein [Anaerolineae bacterium]